MASVPDRGAAANVSESPYLSVVVTARNDDHGGNLLARMQAFVSGLLAQCARYRVPAELIVVEWNPPPDRPRLADALRWTAGDGFCRVRIVEVPEGVHRKFQHWRALPLYQMIAKNAGIRRARGEFVLATNIDILFSDELFELIAGRRLERGKMYRVDRWDVMPDVPADRPIEEQLAWCRTHLLRVNRRDGTFPLHPDGSMKTLDRDVVPLDGSLAMGANWFPRELSGTEPFRWVDNDAELVIRESGDTILSLDVEPGPGVGNERFLLEIRSTAGALLGSALVERRGVVSVPLRNGFEKRSVILHTDYGGIRIASDLRALNFRVFRCQVGRRAAGQPPSPPDAEPVRASGGALARFGRAARVLRKALFSTSEIRIPMSRSALRRLNLRQDESAVTFHLGPLLGRMRGSDGLLSPGLMAIWESGWHEIDYSLGDCFRWMQREGAMTLVLPESGAESLSMTVEAGPAVGFRDARLEVRDDDGVLLANEEIRGRTRVELPVHGVKGMFPLRLQVVGGAHPKVVPGDSRIMALRVLGCEMSPPASRKAGEEAEAQLFEAAPGSGIWCIRGFHLHPEGLMAAPGAEMSVRRADRVTLEIAQRSTAARLAVRDRCGTSLYDGPVSGGQSITISGAPKSGYLYLHFAADRPVILHSVRRPAENDAFAGFEPGSSNRQAVQLHTNGCGDFTLMAREHWFDLRGYPEFDAFSMNIDSTLCWAAHHGGAREEILRDPIRIYHIEHATGSGWTPEGEQKLYQRILAKGLPWIDYYGEVVPWARAMNRLGLPMIFNLSHWGLEQETLPEVIPGHNACGATKG